MTCFRPTEFGGGVGSGFLSCHTVSEALLIEVLRFSCGLGDSGHEENQ